MPVPTPVISSNIIRVNIILTRVPIPAPANIYQDKSVYSQKPIPVPITLCYETYLKHRYRYRKQIFPELVYIASGNQASKKTRNFCYNLLTSNAGSYTSAQCWHYPHPVPVPAAANIYQYKSTWQQETSLKWQ